MMCRHSSSFCKAYTGIAIVNRRHSILDCFDKIRQIFVLNIGEIIECKIDSHDVGVVSARHRYCQAMISRRQA